MDNLEKFNSSRFINSNKALIIALFWINGSTVIGVGLLSNYLFTYSLFAFMFALAGYFWQIEFLANDSKLFDEYLEKDMKKFIANGFRD